MKTISLITFALLVAMGPSFGNDESIEALKQRVAALEKEIKLLKGTTDTLPSQIDAQSIDAPDNGPLVVTVRKGGSMIVNGNEMDSNELTKLLEKLTEPYPDQAVIVRHEESAPFKEILVAIESIKKAHVWNVAFAAIQTGTEQGAAPNP